MKRITSPFVVLCVPDERTGGAHYAPSGRRISTSIKCHLKQVTRSMAAAPSGSGICRPCLGLKPAFPGKLKDPWFLSWQASENAGTYCRLQRIIPHGTPANAHRVEDQLSVSEMLIRAAETHREAT